MVYCARCCLHNSMRALNFFVNIFGVGVIIYTLWLLKKWQDGVTQLPPIPLVPKPRFIYACLGVGIAVCFNTLCSYLVAHCITDSTLLLIYIVFVFSLLCVEVAGVVAIFYKMNWQPYVCFLRTVTFLWNRRLAEYIEDTKFKSFMIFHLYLCRIIAIVILVPQVKCAVLAITLWAIGTEPLTHCDYSQHESEFRCSFLVIPMPPSLLSMSRNGFRHYEALPRSLDQYEYPPRLSFFSHIIRFFRILFRRRVILS